MRKRKIVKSGTSTDIRLSPADVVDFDLSPGDFVDIEEMNKLENEKPQYSKNDPQK